MVDGRGTGSGDSGRGVSCESALAHPLETIGEIAKARGVAVGFVTTARVTHATPATIYAHSPERDWEADSQMPADDWRRGCRDMAYQLVHSAPGGGLASSPDTASPGSSPRVGDMLDYQSAAGSESLYFAYDTVPFELEPTGTV